MIKLRRTSQSRMKHSSQARGDEGRHREATVVLYRPKSRKDLEQLVLVKLRRSKFLACVGHGTLRYFSTLKLIQEGKFRPNTGGVSLMAVTCIGIAIAGSILVIENEVDKAREKEKENTQQKMKV
jgi:hypothetical protein